MARYLTSSSLIESAKLRAMIPEAQVTFRAEDFLRFANEEMDTAVVPYVMSFHEDYFIFPATIPLEPNVTKYSIPYRAVGNKLRDVFYSDTGGNFYEMTRALIEDLAFSQYAINSVRAFTVQNNELCLIPEDKGFSVTGNLKMYYYIRPNQLVTEDRAMTIESINTTTGEITVNAVPNIYSVGTVVDLIQTKSPHKCLSIDLSIANVDSTNRIITIAPASIPTKLEVGDMVCLAEECVIPQIPTDIHSLLAQRIACRCLEAMNDSAGLQAANAKLAEMELKLGAVIQDRVEGAPLKVANRHSALRNSRRPYRR